MDKPLVSIIIPCFNMAHCIFRLLDSILMQDYSSIEVILVNDGSEDRIDEVAEKYRPLFKAKNIEFIFHTQENKGLAGAINAGLQLMSGDYFIWPDADDYLEPDSIETRVNVLEDKKECAVVTGQAYLRKSEHLDTYERVLKESDKNLDMKVQFERMLNGNALFCPGCHMIRTEAFTKVNPAKTIFPARRGQNWQLLLPLYYAYPRAFVDKPVYNYLDFPNSMSSGDTTLEKVLYRYQEHEEILKATLQMIEQNQKVELHPYYSFLEDKYAKLRMEAAIKYKDRKLFWEIYRRKQQLVGLDTLDKFAELRSRFPVFQNPIKFSYRILGRGEISLNPECLISKLKDADSVKNRLPNAQVSVLVACYNGEKYLSTCLDCLLSQSYKNLQVIVVNDGSTDQSEQILSNYEKEFEEKNISYLHLLQKNQGAAAAINASLKYVTGKYIMVYDVDDILYRDAVYEKVWFLEEHPDYMMVRNNGYYITDVDDIGKNLFVTKESDMNDEDIFWEIINGRANNWPSSYMVRAEEFFKRIGGREMYVSQYGQNLQFMLPMAYQSKTGFIRRPLMGYLIHQDSHSHSGGRERSIEKTYGYAMNRIEIVKQMSIPSSEQERCITMIKDNSAMGRVERALQWKEKALYHAALSELSSVNFNAELRWMIGSGSVGVIFRFINKMLRKVRRLSKNLYWSYKLAKENDKGYEQG